MKWIGFAFLSLALFLPSIDASDSWTALEGGVLDGGKLARWHPGCLEQCYFHEVLPFDALAGPHAGLVGLAALLTSEPTLAAPSRKDRKRFRDRHVPLSPSTHVVLRGQWGCRPTPVGNARMKAWGSSHSNF